MKYSFKTNPGKRKDNQDFTGTFLNQSNVLLSLLCDGLGGHQAGDIASEMAVSQIGYEWEQSDFNLKDTHLIQSWLNEQINRENTRIFEAANTYADLEGMGTTLVASIILENEVLFANIGDSRGYVYNDGGLELITEDHSFVSELQRRGELSDDEAKNHINRNALTRSLGVNTRVKVDFFKVPTKEVNVVLLNSDGVSNTLSEEDMIRVLETNLSVQGKAEELIRLAVEKEATDNVTVNLIELEDDSNNEAGE